MVAAVGFEPTPPKRLVNNSVTNDEFCSIAESMTMEEVVFWPILFCKRKFLLSAFII